MKLGWLFGMGALNQSGKKMAGMKKGWSMLGLAAVLTLFSTPLFADLGADEGADGGARDWQSQSAIPCMAGGNPIPINNDQVLEWKKNTPNQYRDRGHVSGIVSRIFSNKNDHNHFEIQIGKLPGEVLEVVYNMNFGRLPNIKNGMNVVACGDYITATQQSGPYPPSPSGAIIHWVHMNPSGKGHESGFLVIDGTIYGQAIPERSLRRLLFDEQFEQYFYSQYP